MDIAVVGTGTMGRFWSDMLVQSPRGRVAAFVDPLIGSDHEPAWLAEHPSAARATDLAALDAAVGAVVITAATPAHRDLIEAALGRGWHVLVEKPFVTDLAQAGELVERADAAGKVLMVSQNYRYCVGPRRVSQLVGDQTYGGLRSLVGRFWCDWAPKPYQAQMQHPMMLEMAIHHLDLARAMGRAEAVAGRAVEWNAAGGPYLAGGAVEALYTMRGEGGTFPFLYSGSLIGKAPRTPWAGLWRFEFDEATLVADTIEGVYGLFVATAGGHELLAPFDDGVSTLADSFDHFHACITEGREPQTSGRDNLGTLRMALGFL